MSNDTPTKVFVYGTLKEGRRLDRKQLAVLRTSVKEATIVGSIYDLGPFPTIKLNDEHTVQGEVHTFESKDFGGVMALMDQIEGYNPSAPDRGLYNRHIVKATLTDGSIVEAWAYEINQDVDDSKRIESGIWEA